MFNFKYQMLWARIGLSFLLGGILIIILNSLVAMFFLSQSIVWYWELLILFSVSIVVLLFYRYIGAFFVRQGKLDTEKGIMILGHKAVQICTIEESKLRNMDFWGTKLVILGITTKDRRYTIWSEDLKGSVLKECSLYTLHDLLKQNIN